MRCCLYYGDLMRLADFDPIVPVSTDFPELSYSKLFPRRSAVVPVSLYVSWSLVSTHQKFLLMVPEWGLMWVASLTLRVYQCEPRSINFTSFQSERWPVLLACSETAEVWVRAKRISLSCSFILEGSSVQPCKPHDGNTCSNCRPLRLRIEIHILPVSRFDLRAARGFSHGEPGFRGYLWLLTSTLRCLKNKQ